MNKHQTGSALVESVIIIALLVGVLAALPVLAKMQSVRQSTVQASRYAAWQMTVDQEPTDRELLVNRFFEDPSAAIKSHRSSISDVPFWAMSSRPLVRDTPLSPVKAGDGFTAANNQSSMVSASDINVMSAKRSASMGQIADTVTSTIRQVSGWLGDKDAIASNDGIAKSTVAVRVASQLFHDSNMEFSNALLLDGWNAQNEHSIALGAEVLVPTKTLKPLGRALSTVSVVPLLKEFKNIDNSFGCVNTLVVETKELTGAVNVEKGGFHDC